MCRLNKTKGAGEFARTPIERAYLKIKKMRRGAREEQIATGTLRSRNRKKKKKNAMSS